MKYLFPAVLTFAVLVLGQFLPQHEVEDLERVIDGDTVEVENDTVRFLGMDTPETFEFTENSPEEFGLEDSNSSVECLEKYGDEATEVVENNTKDSITLLYDRESDRRGFYDRKLAYIHTSQTDITRKLIVDGYARVYPSEFSRKNEFYMWQRQASIEEKGVWSC